MYAGSQGAHVLLSETLAHLVQMPCKVRLGNLVFWSEGWAQCLVMPWKNSTPEPHLQALLRWSWLQQFSGPHFDSESGTELWSVPIPKLPLILSSEAQAGLEFPVRPRVDPPTSTSQVWGLQVWLMIPDLDSAGRLNSGSCCILNNDSTAEQLPLLNFSRLEEVMQTCHIVTKQQKSVKKIGKWESISVSVSLSLRQRLAL